MARLRTPKRLPRLPRLPSMYARITKTLRVTGPGNPPNGFVGANNSASEWVVYWAMWKVFNEPGDVRAAPFLGSPTGRWSYQAPFMGGRRIKGGNVIDFVVNLGARRIAIRVQTERYHIFVNSEIQAYDRMQAASFDADIEVVDIFEQDFIEDHSGVACIQMLRAIIAGEYMPSPLTQGTAYRTKGGQG